MSEVEERVSGRERVPRSKTWLFTLGLKVYQFLIGKVNDWDERKREFDRRVTKLEERPVVGELGNCNLDRRNVGWSYKINFSRPLTLNGLDCSGELR